MMKPNTPQTRTRHEEDANTRIFCNQEMLPVGCYVLSSINMISLINNTRKNEIRNMLYGDRMPISNRKQTQKRAAYVTQGIGCYKVIVKILKNGPHMSRRGKKGIECYKVIVKILKNRPHIHRPSTLTRTHFVVRKDFLQD